MWEFYLKQSNFRGIGDIQSCEWRQGIRWGNCKSTQTKSTRGQRLDEKKRTQVALTFTRLKIALWALHYAIGVSGGIGEAIHMERQGRCIHMCVRVDAKIMIESNSTEGCFTQGWCKQAALRFKDLSSNTPRGNTNMVANKTCKFNEQA